jgi:hypothetical protein
MDVVILSCALFALYNELYFALPFCVIYSFVIDWHQKLTHTERLRWNRTPLTRNIIVSCDCYSYIKNRVPIIDALNDNIRTLVEMIHDVFIFTQRQQRQLTPVPNQTNIISTTDPQKNINSLIDKLDWMLVDNISNIPHHKIKEVKDNSAIQALRHKIEDIMANNEKVRTKLSEMQLDDKLRHFLDQIKKD